MKAQNEEQEQQDNRHRFLFIILCIYTILHISMVVDGILFLDECPVEPNIPMYLVFQGILGLVTRYIGFVKYFIHDPSGFLLIVLCSCLLYFTEFGVFIMGSYWIFREFEPSYKSGDKNYCHEGTYKFAFFYVTIMYGLMLLALITFCCACFASAVFGRKTTLTKPWQIVVI